MKNAKIINIYNQKFIFSINHTLRFAVETLDSIEEVRLFLEPLKSRNIGLQNLLNLKYKTLKIWKTII